MFFSDKTIKTLKEDISSFKETIIKQKEIITDQNKLINDYFDTIERLNHKLDVKDREISNLKKGLKTSELVSKVRKDKLEEEYRYASLYIARRKLNII